MPIVSAYDDAYDVENVMSAQQVGYLYPSANITYGDYLMKLHSTSNDSASLIIYKNNRFVRLFDVYLGESQPYDNFILKLIEIKDGIPLVVVYRLEDEVAWEEVDSVTLEWAKPVPFEGYTVKATAFGEDFVTITVTSDVSSYQDTLHLGNAKSYDNRIKIAVTGINPQGRASAEFYKVKTPRLEASIQTDKLEYAPDDTIRLEIPLAAQPSTNFITANITTNANTTILPVIQSVNRLDTSKTLRAEITDLPVGEELVIRVELEAYNYFEQRYSKILEKRINIPSTIVVKKSVEPVEVDTTREVNITLYLYNSASNTTDILLEDVLPESFEQVTNLPVSISLGPKNETTLTYTVLPTSAGFFELDGTRVTWNNVTVTSNKVSLLVHGPLLVISKKLVGIDGDIATIELGLVNEGDRDADVILRDTVPVDGELLTGGTIWTGILPAGERVNTSYTIRFANDRISPPAKADYSDLRGTKKQVESNLLRIKSASVETIEKEDLELEPESTLSGLAVSFVVLFSIIGSIFGVLYLILRRRQS